jgi:glucan-binding YG repeat protein
MKVRWHWVYVVLLLLMIHTSVTENININSSDTNSLSNSQSSQLETTKDKLDVRENTSSNFLDEIVVKMEDVSNESVDYQKKVRKTKKFIPKSSSSTKHPKKEDRSKNKKKKKKEKKIVDEANAAHSRKKRMIWITDDGRLALPPGTSLSNTVKLLSN